MQLVSCVARRSDLLLKSKTSDLDSPVSDPGVKFDKWLTRARLDKPTKFDGESNEGGDHVKAFLSELQRYFAVTDLPFVSWGAVTPHFLEKSALLMWELEFQGIIVTHGPTAVTWAMFEKFMHDQYGRLQPACETRAAYEELRESDFDSVTSFIRAFRIKERELVGTPYHPGGGAIFDFIRKLSPAVRKYVQDNAPEERWTDVTQVYKKALDFELNRRAAVQGDTGKRVGAPLSQSDNGKSAKRAKTVAEASEPRVNTGEWNARVKAGKCAACGLSGHKFRVDGKHTCLNKKNPAAHGTITSAVPMGLLLAAS